MRVLELYSGIGGMHYALKESGVGGEVVASVEINPNANEVYKHNHPTIQNINRNIESLSIEDIRKLSIDSIFMSPPCQPFTRVGLKKDLLDERSCSLKHVLSLIPKIETLNYVLLENVKGFEKSQARDKLVECLDQSDFNYKELILSPCQFGIPNTRHRYYLIAKKKSLEFIFDKPDLIEHLPPETLQILPEAVRNKMKICCRIKSMLEKNVQGYCIPGNVLGRRAWVMDIQTADSGRSCCFTKAYGHYVEGTGSVFCPLSKEEMEEKYSEAKKCEDSEERLRLLAELRLRYFTPREVARLMCFPESFEFPGKTTDRQKYKLLGNSLNVHVVGLLIFLLKYGEEV